MEWIMLITIVLIAEALVFVWFTVFSLMLLSMYLDSRGMPAAHSSAARNWPLSLASSPLQR
jgi:hypothetical protein